MKAKKYRIWRDRQGTGWGAGKVQTTDEWIENAREWAELDGNPDLDNYLEQMQKHREDFTDDDVLSFIDEIWAIEFEEVV